jgi:hypothetical protein
LLQSISKLLIWFKRIALELFSLDELVLSLFKRNKVSGNNFHSSLLNQHQYK